MNDAAPDVPTDIDQLGPPGFDSPMHYPQLPCQPFVGDDDRVVLDVNLATACSYFDQNRTPPAFEAAGPRGRIYFDPREVRSAVVTCGGLCPGINDVIRAIVLQLHHNYGAEDVLGIRHGLRGLTPNYEYPPLELTPKYVADIHRLGGTVLGSSRGSPSVSEMVDALEFLGVRILFAIGGDGTLRAVEALVEEFLGRNLDIAVVGIPKTIDNDIYMVDKSFGFDTAVESAAEVIASAHTESRGAPDGIGLVKLMGRNAGFIASMAPLAMREVNFVLIPEIDFDLYGQGGLLQAIEQRLDRRRHAVIVVAEGAGQKFFADKDSGVDASGNKKLGDIGLFLKEEITKYFHEKNRPANLKYIDPSYIIRSQPANANDRIYCGFLGQHAVHAAMAGKTGLVISRWNNRYVHVPVKAVTMGQKRVEPESPLWRAVIESTGQPTCVARR